MSDRDRGSGRVQGAPRQRRAFSAVRWVAAPLGFGLLAFHAWLLWTRVRDASLLEPRSAARWAASAALLLAALALRRRGVRLLEGRRALAVAVCVLLLHLVGSPAAAGDARVEPLLALPVSLTLGLAVGLAFRPRQRGARRRAAPRHARIAARAPRPPRPAQDFLPRIACLPPPALAPIGGQPLA